ncbi:MAG: acetate/propionate family kinase [Thiohalomonadales bacterium]
MNKVLVINSGSSSIKYQLFDMDLVTALTSGAIERIGESKSVHRQRTLINAAELTESCDELLVPDHSVGLSRVFSALIESGVISELSQLSAVGHRVVHGGESFRGPVRITDAILQKIRALVPFAPLHNPANILGIEVALSQVPDIPQIAVFDTAYHQSIPDYAYRYALPQELYTELRIRRYGFHGTSHFYVAKQAARHLGKPLESLNLISLHLGNGASAAAIAGGKSVDTSMGMTPLEGLMMGTRCGDIDPAIHAYLSRTSSLGSEEIERMLNTESGLKGISGSNDMREVHQLAETGNKQAQLALEMYCYRIKKYIGAYYAVLGELDAVIFTGGIGENDAWVREQCCRGLEALGIRIDKSKNNLQNKGVVAIQQESGAINLLVIPTNEELEIALQTVNCIC